MDRMALLQALQAGASAPAPSQGRAKWVNGRFLLDGDQRGTGRLGNNPLSAWLSEIGGAGGATGGAAIGASLGTVVPGIGNIVGGVAGGAIGGLLGAFGGKAAENKLRDNQNLLGEGGSFKSALGEGAISGAFGAAGPAWQGYRGITTLGKASGGGFKLGLETLRGAGDDATKAMLGKALSTGGKKAALKALYGDEGLNMLQIAGRGVSGNAGGVGIGSKAPGLENLGASSQDDILKALKDVGIGRGNPEKMLRSLEPIQNTIGQRIGNQYAKSTVKLSSQQTNDLLNNILTQIVDDPSINLSSQAEKQLMRQLQILGNKRTPQAVWEFQKAMGNSINFGKGVEAKLVDREAIARIFRANTAKLLDDVVPEVASSRNLFHTLSDADKLMRVASKQADKSGLIARVFTSAPVRGGEAKIGGLIEGAGNVLANQGVDNTLKFGRGVLARGIANNALYGGGPQGEQPVSSDLTSSISSSSQFTNPQASQPPYTLQQGLADAFQILGPDQSPSTYLQYAKALQDQATAQGESSTGQAKAANASAIIDELASVFSGAGGPQGPLAGRLTLAGALAGGGNQNAKAYQDLRSAYTAQISRALGEVGVLTDKDREVIQKAIPSINDSPEAAQIKIQTLRNILAEISGRGTSSNSSSLISALGQLQDQGYNY